MAEALVCGGRTTAGRAPQRKPRALVVSSRTPRAAVRLKGRVWAGWRAKGERTQECSGELEGPDEEAKQMRRGLSVTIAAPFLGYLCPSGYSD